MSAWDNLLSHALSGTGGATLSALAAWYWSLRRDRREDRGAEIQALRDTMAELREEVERVRERQIESDKAEDLCRRNLRLVHDALHAMVDALRREGVTVPQVPGWPPAGE